MKDLAALVLLIWWLAGVVLASGFWATLFAASLPPYALYLVVQRALLLIGIA